MRVVYLKNLKKARGLRGFTLRSLAEVASVTPATISWVENLKQGAEPKTIRALAKALRVKPEELIGDGETYEKLHGPNDKPKRRPGRPSGITKYGEPSQPKTHRMTPTAHQWVKENKDWIEKKARS